MLPEGGKQRCSACGSRLRARKRPIVLGQDSRLDARPLLLVERELEARIEAETAGRFRQRRRAAKVARRIAALPPTIVQGEAGAAVDPEVPTPQPAQASPVTVDLPAAAVHEVTSRPIVDHPAEPVVEVAPELVVDQTAAPAAPAPEPVVETMPVEPRRRRGRRRVKAARPDHARANVGMEAEADPQTDALEDARVAEPIEQPAPVEPVVEDAPEPVVEVVPVAPAGWQPSANSAWIDRVFSSAPGVGRTETITWPRPPTPVAPLVDPEADSVAGQSSSS